MITANEARANVGLAEKIKQEKLMNKVHQICNKCELIIKDVSLNGFMSCKIPVADNGDGVVEMVVQEMRNCGFTVSHSSLLLTISWEKE